MELVAVWVAENDLGEWRTATGIVDNVLDDAANVAVTLCVVVGSELRWGLVETFSDNVSIRPIPPNRARRVRTGVGGEDRAAALPLVADDTTHDVLWSGG